MSVSELYERNEHLVPRRWLRAFDDVAIGCALVALVFRAFRWYPYDAEDPTEDEFLAESA